MGRAASAICQSDNLSCPSAYLSIYRDSRERKQRNRERKIEKEKERERDTVSVSGGERESRKGALAQVKTKVGPDRIGSVRSQRGSGLIGIDALASQFTRASFISFYLFYFHFPLLSRFSLVRLV